MANPESHNGCGPPAYQPLLRLPALYAALNNLPSQQSAPSPCWLRRQAGFSCPTGGGGGRLEGSGVACVVDPHIHGAAQLRGGRAGQPGDAGRAAHIHVRACAARRAPPTAVRPFTIAGGFDRISLPQTVCTACHLASGTRPLPVVRLDGGSRTGRSPDQQSSGAAVYHSQIVFGNHVCSPCIDSLLTYAPPQMLRRLSAMTGAGPRSAPVTLMSGPISRRSSATVVRTLCGDRAVMSTSSPALHRPAPSHPPTFMMGLWRHSGHAATRAALACTRPSHLESSHIQYVDHCHLMSCR